MFVFDLTNPLTLLLVALATGLLIFLGQEIKKSSIAIIPLILFLILLISHVVQVASPTYSDVAGNLYKSLIWDFVFILITFFSYLWIDDLEAKKNNIKSIDSSLDWFWKEI